MVRFSKVYDYNLNNLINHQVFIGVEPTYHLSENFSFYTNIGMQFMYNSNTKFINTDDPDFDPANKTFPLKDRDDSFIQIGLDGMILGFRYIF